jgi:GLPGLI family protein
MKKIIILFLIQCNLFLGQTNNSIAIYSVKNTGTRPEKQLNEIEEEFQLAKEAVNDIQIQLRFNNDLCETSYNGDITKLNKIQRRAAIISGCRTATVLSKKENKLYTFIKSDPAYHAESVLIHTKLDTIWNITSQTKKIQDYTCIKATQTKTKPNGTKYISTAWFCPEIPFSFGPFKHIGLPGLILELDTDSKLFGLISLNLNSNNQELTIPKATNLVSEEEYAIKSEQQIKEFEKEYEKRLNKNKF